jgi:hypothetical protein
LADQLYIAKPIAMQKDIIDESGGNTDETGIL